MLLPDKHVKFSESLIGLGSHILELLDRPKTIDELWTVFESSCTHGSYPSKHSLRTLFWQSTPCSPSVQSKKQNVPEH